MANKIYKLALFGIMAILVFGAYMAYTGYQNNVYPLDLARGNLEGIGASSDPQTILNYLKSIKTNLPQEGNPVWIFPTETTNFARIQSDLDIMILSVEKISTVPKDSSGFHTGMLDVSQRASILKENLEDATPYMYVSVSNIIFSSIWIAVIIGIFAVLKRKKEQLIKDDTLDV